ncbi:hypothetical protein Mapa_007824 [Marchantia paleacea]|nr:hypothetical protein Mapa_007824 [Marchantia paleacea]
MTVSNHFSWHSIEARTKKQTSNSNVLFSRVNYLHLLRALILTSLITTTTPSDALAICAAENQILPKTHKQIKKYFCFKTKTIDLPGKIWTRIQNQRQKRRESINRPPLKNLLPRDKNVGAGGEFRRKRMLFLME